jgi:hypothetical protein
MLSSVRSPVPLKVAGEWRSEDLDRFLYGHTMATWEEIQELEKP